MSDRERTVLLLAAEGLTDKEIARRLSLSQRTIGTYWERMRLKLGPFSRTQLVARFLRTEAEGDSDGAIYSSLFSSWHEGIWILSLGGETIFANRHMSNLFGLSAEEFPDAEIRRLFEDAANEGIEMAVAQCLNEPQNFELRLPRAQGVSAWVNLSGSAIRDTKGRCTAVIFLAQERTAYKRVQHALLASESALDFLSENTSDFVVRFDAQLRCVAMNPALREFAGARAAEAIGKPIGEIADLFQPSDVWQSSLREAYEAGEARTFRSEWSDHADGLTTVTRPFPSPDLNPATLIAVTKRKG